MHGSRRSAILLVLPVLVSGLVAVAQSRKEYHFKVHRRPSVYVLNPYGPISVKPAANRQVVVTAVASSDRVAVELTQSGNRISVVSRLLPGADVNSGRVEYEVLVPADASVMLHSTTGPLHAEKLHGDVILEGNTASVDVRDLSEGHIHVKTLDGPVTLTNVSDGHVEVTSVGGDVALKSVNGPFIQVNSSTGKIQYDGDFGEGGEYSLTSHTGDIEATAPSYASIDVVARSIQGKVENDFPLRPASSSFAVKAGSAFAGTIGKAASSVRLLSFSGKIHLKKR